MSEKASPLFQAAVNQVHIHPYSEHHAGEHSEENREAWNWPNFRPYSLHHAGKHSGDNKGEAACTGWCPYPLVAARLGLHDSMVGILKETISKWQTYVQGFGHWGLYPNLLTEIHERWLTNIVKDVDTGEKLPFPVWPFRHFYNEAMNIVCTGVNEMLLQSHDEIIRLFPATPQTWNAAMNGFMVNTEYTAGQVSWVCIESNLGKVCQLVNPWEQQQPYGIELDVQGNVSVIKAAGKHSSNGETILEFSTTAGNRYLLTLNKEDFAEWIVEPISYNRNHSFKQLGDAKLGLPRMF